MARVSENENESESAVEGVNPPGNYAITLSQYSKINPTKTESGQGSLSLF